jgi:hypothetical protein
MNKFCSANFSCEKMAGLKRAAKAMRYLLLIIVSNHVRKEKEIIENNKAKYQKMLKEIKENVKTDAEVVNRDVLDAIETTSDY